MVRNNQRNIESENGALTEKFEFKLRTLGVLTLTALDAWKAAAMSGSIAIARFFSFTT